MADFMRDSDAFSWYMERDPTLRSTVVAVAWLEHSPDFDAVRSKLDAASRIVSSFRKKLLEPPLRLATPRWTVDDEFDLSCHVHRIDAPEPRTNQAVIEFARQAAMTAFDRARPLWDFTLIDHVDGERAAFVMKLHHSLTDGVGGMQLALLLFDPEGSCPPFAPMPDAPLGERVDTATLVRESIVHDLRMVSTLAGGCFRKAIPAARELALHPLGAASGAVETLRSIGRTIAPVRSTLSPVMKDRGVSRKLDMLEVSLEDLKSASRMAGGTLNDGFLASVTGGLRRYHERRGADVDSLRVTLPINIRTPDDPMGGNRITLMRFALHARDPDPLSRVAEADRMCRRARSERSLGLTNAIAGALNLLPARAVGSMLKHVDFLASDVPGFDFPVYLGGAPVERYVSFGPTIGSSVNLTLLSYNGTCFVGVTVDSVAVPDDELLVESLREGFEEVLRLGGDHSPVGLPLHDQRPRASSPRNA